ncbi:interferon-induced, double-stranded RNA-activated protein kinase [Acanthochromis polyacanthus]|uniref:interferon-induced, double-stranded RNA-activated protein kinase n=1 Tax=Acanthochromis polyacanthus TaxID=80966 RepID=UPI0022347961|nr:interferon-induced, double-stranded RNA-activated protein kinase [Acanthochromis polyacanthus]
MMESENYVAKLNEFVQRNRLVLRYEDVGSAGPDHIKTFTLRVVVNGKAYPDGVGKNKKEAKQNAAKNALRVLLEETADSTEHAAEASTTPVRQTTLSSTNYVGWLNEYGQKHRVNVRSVESSKIGPLFTTQYCRFVVGDKEYPPASGKSKREAKEEAAKLVYHEIFGSRTTKTGEEKDSNTSSQQREELNKNVADICDLTKNLSVRTKESSFAETNFIGIVHNYCQKTNRTCTFMEAGRSGPPHNRKFFHKLLINNKEYPVGEGKNVKEAKQNAAQLAWDALQEQSDYDSKINWSAASDDGAPAKPSRPSSSLDSGFPKSTSSSLNPPEDQHASPDIKMSIAANFPKDNESSKEDLMPNFKLKTAGSTKIEKTASQSVSRFTTDFDSIEQLGKGAFGHVFKAKHKLLDVYYAIKIVRYKEKALREVKALSDLDHSNIVRYYTCWKEDSEYHWESHTDSSTATQSSSDSSTKYLYIQMELCDTRTLRVWIYEKNAQNVKKSLRDSKRREESLSIAPQLVSGVEYIHSKMLIHRDLKPANIMFGRDGEVKIGDFGLVTAENDDDAENLMERTVYKGTPSYMAPEQKCRNTYDRKVDIFALGLIYFELLWNISTGHERLAIWEDVRNQKLPEGFSHHFQQESQIIKSMLCVKPEDRPEASKLKTDLEECKQSLVMPEKIQRDSHSV